MVQIVLVMIVKNESKIIQRCLSCAKPVISRFSIVDTGSTDATVDLIHQWSKQNNIPGNVVQRPWKNFGHNRSESFTEAKKYILEQGLNPADTYALFLDADMMLQVKPGFKPSSLKQVGYSLLQFHGFLNYHNLRLARFDADWKCVGVTHEYWNCNQNISFICEGLVIDDQEDGGAKADKFERDERLLLEGLKDEPQNERYMFYLAQTYSCLGRLQESIDWYKKRVEKGGWYEEVWYSHYKIVENFLRMNDIPSAMEWTLKGYDYYPKRNETFKILAEHLRRADKFHLAYYFADMGEKIPYPEQDRLFLQKDSYTFKISEIKILTCFYIQKLKEGMEACERLFVSEDAPPPHKMLALQNAFFYVPKTSCTTFKVDLPWEDGSKWSLRCEGTQVTAYELNKNCIRSYMGTLGSNSWSGSVGTDVVKVEGGTDDVLHFFIETKDDFTLVKEKSLLKISVNGSVTSVDQCTKVQPIYFASVNKPKKGQVASLVRNYITSDYKMVDSLGQTICDLNPKLYECKVATNGVDFEWNGKKGLMYMVHMIEEAKNLKYARLVWWTLDGTSKKFSIPFYYTQKGNEEMCALTRTKDSLVILYKVLSEKTYYLSLMKFEDIISHLMK